MAFRTANAQRTKRTQNANKILFAADKQYTEKRVGVICWEGGGGEGDLTRCFTSRRGIILGAKTA